MIKFITAYFLYLNSFILICLISILYDKTLLAQNLSVVVGNSCTIAGLKHHSDRYSPLVFSNKGGGVLLIANAMNHDKYGELRNQCMQESRCQAFAIRHWLTLKFLSSRTLYMRAKLYNNLLIYLKTAENGKDVVKKVDFFLKMTYASLLKFYYWTFKVIIIHSIQF